MKTGFIIASVLALAFTTPTFAAPTDFTDNVTYTTDTLSGLDWLDVTTSVNQSYDYVSSQFGTGGIYDGWRYATGYDFNTLVGNYTGVEINTNSLVSQEPNLIDGLVTLLGSTLDVFSLVNNGFEWENYQYTYGMISDVYPDLLDYQYVAIISDNNGGCPTCDTGEDFSMTHYGFVGKSDSGALHYGSYLIRDSISAVPIPAAAFMFAPALLGFLGLRRRAKSIVA